MAISQVNQSSGPGARLQSGAAPAQIAEVASSGTASATSAAMVSRLFRQGSGQAQDEEGPGGGQGHSAGHAAPDGRTAAAGPGGQADSQAGTPEDATKNMALDTALQLAEKYTAFQGVALEFNVHEDSGRLQVIVTDKATGKLVRKIPEDEFLSLAQRIKEYNGGPLLNDRAL